MHITELTTNHMKNPLGYDFQKLHLSWKVSEAAGTRYEKVRIQISQDPGFWGELLYDSKIRKDYACNFWDLSLDLESCTRYFWRVFVEDETGDRNWSSPAWFETAKQGGIWNASFIAPEETRQMPWLKKEFSICRSVKQARIYAYGAGLYELYVNKEKAGEEYLLPGYHSYDFCMEYNTFDVTGLLHTGENRLDILLGEGWYKGRFGFDGNYENLYGNQKKCILELHIWYKDGGKEVIGSDGTFESETSEILENNIYDGEVIDETVKSRKLTVQVLTDGKERLCPRSNPSIKKTEQFTPKIVEHRDTSYLLLDFGEEVTGWVELEGEFLENQKLTLYYGEVLQEGEFYRDNLRSAKARFEYRSKGGRKHIRPHFTYYGFRYVKVTGLQKGQDVRFTAYRLMSELKISGYLETSSRKVNQLFKNTLRSQKCNFLDIPTDCPQRDERMGWTGDTAIFAGTACFHMDCASFYRHYLKSLREEQIRMNGSVPFFSPLPKIPYHEGINPFYVTGGGCAWGDVAVVLPWTLYQYYGDRQMLEECYPIMTDWTDFVKKRTEENAKPYLWQNDRQLGDWLALDNEEDHSPAGKTDTGMLASAYFYQAALLCEKASRVLDTGRQTEYGELKEKIRAAFLAEYFKADGSLAVEETQTGYAFLLYLGLYPEGAEHRLILGLKELLWNNQNRLDTGFIGTPVLCPVLSAYGCNQEAYGLLLNEEYPGWLYEVNLGATTVWERWDSLLADGTVSGTGMNSLNHYAYGSIAEWMYRYMAGFSPSMNESVKMTIRPMPQKRIRWIKGAWDSPYGVYRCQWRYQEEKVIYRIEIPFGANARVILPDGKSEVLGAGTYQYKMAGVSQEGDE